MTTILASGLDPLLLCGQALGWYKAGEGPAHWCCGRGDHRAGVYGFLCWKAASGLRFLPILTGCCVIGANGHIGLTIDPVRTSVALEARAESRPLQADRAP